MRDYFLPFALPDLDGTELEEIRDSLETGWITTGPKTREFEQKFAEYIGAPQAVAVNSGTAAMHLSLEAIGLKEFDVVITTPYTFAATAEVIRYFGAIPVFVDVETDTLNMDIEKLREVLEKLYHNNQVPLPKSWHRSTFKSFSQVKAILPVHLAGYPCNLDAIYELANQYNLAVVEDAAHALPTFYNNRLIGSFRDTPSISKPHFVCFSFYATKPLATGEGGMIITNDENLADRCRIMSLHGISKDAWKRYTAEGSWYYEIIAPGYKYNMTDIAAALGLAQLQKVERMWMRRKEIAMQYQSAFRNVEAFQIPHDDDQHQHAWHLYMLRLNLEKLIIDRSQFIEELKKRKIGASVHFIPLHIHPYYSKTFGYQPEDYPISYREYLREISLPIYSKMSDEDVRDVIEAVIEVCEKFGK